MADPNQQRHIAIVCDTVPYPPRSGDNQRLAELIDALREQGWFVHLILAALLDGRLRQLCRRHVDALHSYSGMGWRTRTRNGLRRLVRFFDRLGISIGLPPAEEIASRLLGRSLTPIVLDYWRRYPQGLDHFIAKLVNRYPLKAVIVEYIWLYPAAAQLNHGIARLLDTHDIQHKRVVEFASRGMTFPLSITQEEEVGIFKRFDSVIAIQAQEAALVRTLCPELRVLTVGSTGSSPTLHAPRPVDGRILYIGGYNGANIDGLRRFLESVWPQIRQQYEKAHLHICGYIYRAFLSEHFDGVKFLKHVEDVEAQYAEVSVVVNPTWIGTGLKIKCVDALARGKPLVTTNKGIEGLHEEVETACRVADDEHDFAAHVVDLLANSNSRDNQANAARRFAETHLTKKVVYKELLDFLDQWQ
jgi:glycosyltransferase involved in cell wall biosynthesis